ncbi:hypothetical protein [Pelomonas sp. KK5]|uniref:hypothetical protein n=1 Tax=Pelomonas sp. KK5 TaxID=1855730 RepID=UPI00097CBB6E|nr:hypothetical protein [Pelomonas sp. KK5]
MTVRSVLLMLCCCLLAACAGPKYTVDDGRKVDEVLLGNIRAYGAGEQLLRPAIQRSAALKDPECDKQWELPFAVATSYGWSENDRVAWVRGLNVDERLTVVAATPDSPLHLGDRIVKVGSRDDKDSTDLLEAMAAARDDREGRPFTVTLASGRNVQVAPFQVCRGYTRLAPPNTPKLQDYHWLMSMHPLEITRADLTEDEALWVVLWTQGLSEEGGARMKTYHYGMKVAGTLYNLVTLATGLKGAAMAADAAIAAAKNAAAQVAQEMLKQQLIEQGKSLAIQKIREGLTDAAQSLTRQQVVDGLQMAAVNRGSLSGVARIGATVFDRADSWAFTNAGKLGANPLAGFTLHQKLIERGLTANSIVFDVDRLAAINKIAEARGLGSEVTAILRGLKPDDLQYAIGSMPLASAPTAFSYESASDPGSGLFSRGLIDAMLEIPAESGPRK